MLNVRRVEELHDDFIGDICVGDDDELFETGDRIRLVNEPSLFKVSCSDVDEGGVGKGGDGEASSAFSFSSLPVEGTIVSDLSSLIRVDSDLEKYVVYR